MSSVADSCCSHSGARPRLAAKSSTYRCVDKEEEGNRKLPVYFASTDSWLPVKRGRATGLRQASQSLKEQEKQFFLQNERPPVAQNASVMNPPSKTFL